VAWEPIKTAPTNRRVLVADDKGSVFIAKAATLRWRDDADRLIDRPRWWQSLPEPPSEASRPRDESKDQKAKAELKAGKTRRAVVAAETVKPKSKTATKPSK
jgi:hypothetical protein